MRGIVAPPIRVAILDDHQTIVDGVNFRLSQSPEIELVGTAAYGSELDLLLADCPVDVLIMDINVPVSPQDPHPYPVLHVIPRLLDRCPGMSILVLTAYSEVALIREVMDRGASGYVLKEDGAATQRLAAIVQSVAAGGIYLSEKARQQLNSRRDEEPKLSPRQLEILSLACAYPNFTSTQLAGRLGLAPSTVRNQLSRAYLTLDVRNLAAAIMRARDLGLITPFPDRDAGHEGVE